MMQAAREGVAAANNGPREDSCCHGFCHYLGPMAARYPYAGLFLLASFFTWVVRESEVIFFLLQQRLSGCRGDRSCLQAEGVLLISMTSFLFFAVMSLSTMFTTKLQDLGNLWHSQWWSLKCLLLSVVALITSTLAPTYWVQLYGNVVAPVGAGIFISLQMISVIRYITRLNCKWCLTNFEQRYFEVILVSFVAYSASTAGGIFMIIWYKDSWFNTVFICTTLLLVYLMPLIALTMSKANGRYMEPGLLGVYILFICWTAIRSEPETSGYQKEKASSGEKWKTMISFVFGLISIVVAAFSTGSDYKSIQFTNVVDSEDDIPYGYGFFHCVFALGSMYFGMLFVGWDTHHTMEKWNVDVGWMCTWMHIVNEALAVMSFVAILLARTCGLGWLRQLLARIFGIGGHQQGGDQSQIMELEMDTGPPPSPLSHTPDQVPNYGSSV